MKKILVIDMDPQANATDTLTRDQIDEDQSIASIFGAEPSHNLVRVFSTRFEGVDLIPSHLTLTQREFQTARMKDPQLRLPKLVSSIKSQYDFILIDCPPSLGLFTLNALVASEKLLIPLQLERYSVLGLRDLLSTYQVVKEINPELSILGVLPYMVDKRYKVHHEIADELKKIAEKKNIPFLHKQLISTSAQIKLAASGRKTIHEQTKQAMAYKQFNTLAIWLGKQV